MQSAAAVVTVLISASTGLGVPAPVGVQYGEFWQQSMEVYKPANPCGPAPLVIYIHGGGWLTGSSEDVAPYLSNLADRGFVIASLNYSYSQNALWPAQIHDCKGAIRWLRANAETFNIDTNRIAVFGDSAGAHLAALVGTSGDVPELEGNVGGNLSYSSRVHYVATFAAPTDLIALAQKTVSLNGEISQLFNWPIEDIIANLDNPNYADLVALVNSANPINFVSSDDPPFRIVHGLDDELVPASQSQMLHDALVASSVPSTYQELPGWAHDLPEFMYDEIFNYFQSEFKYPWAGPGDFDCNLQVNVDDLLVVINNWGACQSQSDCPGDTNDNLMVDVDDLLQVINDWSL